MLFGGGSDKMRVYKVQFWEQHHVQDAGRGCFLLLIIHREDAIIDYINITLPFFFLLL